MAPFSPSSRRRDPALLRAEWRRAWLVLLSPLLCTLNVVAGNSARAALGGVGQEPTQAVGLRTRGEDGVLGIGRGDAAAAEANIAAEGMRLGMNSAAKFLGGPTDGISSPSDRDGILRRRSTREKRRRGEKGRNLGTGIGTGLWGGALAIPQEPIPSFYTPRDSISGLGPCTGVQNPVTISVTSFADISKRVNIPPTTTVVLEFQNGFSLPHTLVLADNFSCTFLLAAPGADPHLTASWSNAPAVLIYNTSNVVMHGISVKHGISSSSPSCTFSLFNSRNGAETKTLTCPGFYILRSFGVQVGDASIYGRIDVFRSWYVKLDSLVVTTAEDAYDKAVPYRSPDTHGIIRMGQMDIGPTFVASNNVISNCEVYGHYELITLYMGAVGVTVRNNYLHHFIFPACRCGANEDNAFDCFLNYIGYNYIWNPLSWRQNGSPQFEVNNAGIYTYIHWFNPGNYMSCNYIVNTQQCIYLDSASSGVTIDGGVCQSTYVGMKVNNGKFNKISNVIMSDCQAILSQVTCVVANTFTYRVNPTVRGWEGVRRTYYNTPEINAAFPFMHTIADPVPSAYNGVKCNPSCSGCWPASTTGKCSGLAYGNTVDVFGYNPPPDKRPTHYNHALNFTMGLIPYDESCNDLPAMQLINSQKWHNVTDPKYRFANPKDVRFGLRSGSVLLKEFPNFKVCSRKDVGPQAVLFATFDEDFNIQKPKLFQAMLDFVTVRRVQAPLQGSY